MRSAHIIHSICSAFLGVALIGYVSHFDRGRIRSGSTDNYISAKVLSPMADILAFWTIYKLDTLCYTSGRV
jgi:hypothetical protein